MVVVDGWMVLMDKWYGIEKIENIASLWDPL